MKQPEWLTNYCNNHGYTDPEFIEGQWWAFPPNGVMSVPIPRPQPTDYAPPGITVEIRLQAGRVQHTLARVRALLSLSIEKTFIENKKKTMQRVIQRSFQRSTKNRDETYAERKMRETLWRMSNE